MAEIRTVTTLRSKRDEIASAIQNYEKRLAQARADLAHVNACITLFVADGDTVNLAPYVDLHRLLKRGEGIALCKEALALGPKTTRELALYIMERKGLDAGDKVLAKSICGTIIHSLRMQHKRGQIQDSGKRKGVRVWQLPEWNWTG